MFDAIKRWVAAGLLQILLKMFAKQCFHKTSRWLFKNWSLKRQFNCWNIIFIETFIFEISINLKINSKVYKLLQTKETLTVNSLNKFNELKKNTIIWLLVECRSGTRIIGVTMQRTEMHFARLQVLVVIYTKYQTVGSNIYRVLDCR